VIIENDLPRGLPCPAGRRAASPDATDQRRLSSRFHFSCALGSTTSIAKSVPIEGAVVAGDGTHARERSPERAVVAKIEPVEP
jgi:hypothetical protein